jgi:hypothetical protein
MPERFERPIHAEDGSDDARSENLDREDDPARHKDGEQQLCACQRGQAQIQVLSVFGFGRHPRILGVKGAKRKLAGERAKLALQESGPAHQ